MEIEYNSIEVILLASAMVVLIMWGYWKYLRAKKRVPKEGCKQEDEDLTLEERAQRIVDLEDGLHLHETFWGAALYPTASIIAEYNTVIALCKEILPDVPKHPELLKKHIAKHKRNRRKYVKHREEEVKELVRERLDERGLEHIEIRAVVLFDEEAE